MQIHHGCHGFFTKCKRTIYYPIPCISVVRVQHRVQHLHVSTRSWFVCSRFPLYNFGKLYNLRFNGQHLRFHLFRLVFSTRLLHHHYYYYFPRSKYQYIHSSVAWISVRGMGRSVVGLLQGMRGRQTRARGRIFLNFNGKSIENIKNSMEI